MLPPGLAISWNCWLSLKRMAEQLIISSELVSRKVHLAPTLFSYTTSVFKLSDSAKCEKCEIFIAEVLIELSSEPKPHKGSLLPANLNP